MKKGREENLFNVWIKVPWIYIYKFIPLQARISFIIQLAGDRVGYHFS